MATQHPNKEIRAAIEYAQNRGWRCVTATGVYSMFTAHPLIPRRPQRVYVAPLTNAITQVHANDNFSLPIPTVDDALVNALYSRYSDMSIGSCHAQMYVACDREASCLESAIDSAVTDLRAMGIQPLRIELDVPELAA